MKIVAPNKDYTGVSASVSFVNGIGKTDNPHLIKWFQEHGYTVEDRAEISPTLDNSDEMPGSAENIEQQAEKPFANAKKANKGKKSERKEEPEVAPVQLEATSEPGAMPDPGGE